MKYFSKVVPIAALTLALALVPADRKSSTITILQNCALVPSTRIHALPRIHNRDGTASNWGGYAVETSLTTPQKHAVSSVQGSWQIPALSASTSPDTYSALWVGIDGYSDNKVEQLGTEQDWTPDGQTNYAWFEMYPRRGFIIPDFPLEPGDTVSASVNYAGRDQFILSITNITKGVAYTVPARHSRMRAPRESAEWIVEAPAGRRVLPLADFGTASFSGCSAIVNGINGAIDNPAWQYDPINMTADGTVKAQPSALTDSTVQGSTVSAFSAQWYHE